MLPEGELNVAHFTRPWHKEVVHPSRMITRFPEGRVLHDRTHT